MPERKKDRGLLVVLSGPSGVGKDSIIRELVKEDPSRFHSVSMTTRKPRRDEEEGRSYYFTGKEDFEKMIQKGEILEYDTYLEEYYGTPKAPIEQMIEEDIDVFLDLTIKGALELKKNYPGAVIVFITAPDCDTLRHRLLCRGTETAEVIEKRLRAAEEEIRNIQRFDYWVENDRIPDAAADVAAIIRAEKRRTSRHFLDGERPETV